MFRRFNTVSLPVLLTQLFPTCNLTAEPLDANPYQYPREILYAEMPAEIIRDGERFKNIDDDSQLRRHINQQDTEKAHMGRLEKKLPEGKKSHALRQSEEQSGEESLNQPINGGDGAPR